MTRRLGVYSTLIVRIGVDVGGIMPKMDIVLLFIFIAVRRPESKIRGLGLARWLPPQTLLSGLGR